MPISRPAPFLPGCNSFRTHRRGPAEPEVWFRIVHVTLDERNGAPTYREQTVKIELWPEFGKSP